MSKMPEQATEIGASAASASGEQSPEQTGAQVELDDSQMAECYANFCRVTGTPEEVVIDFGLNVAPSTQPPKSIKLTQRVVLNFYTAKRLLGALNMSIQRHETVFGVLETDVQKRVKGGQGS